MIDGKTVRDTFRFTDPDLDSFDTVNAILDQRGWIRTDHLIYCLDCVEDKA